MSFDSARFGELFLEPQRNGLTRPKKMRGTGFPMVNMGELFAHPRIHDISMDLVPVDEKEYHYLLKAGDLLFARQSLVLSGAGQCSIFLGNSSPTVFESHLIRCRLDARRSNSLFYFYFFKSPEGRRVIEAIVEQGAGASGIRGSDLVNVEVPNPPKQVQDKIANILGLIDDHITLLRETNATLEAIAQALFKSWFVDFDPVHANIAAKSATEATAQGGASAAQGMTAGVPEAGQRREPLPTMQAAALDAATAALFPDSFEESELGLVPRGWRMLPLDEAYEINPSRKLKKGEVAPYLDMASVGTQGHVVSGVVDREMGSGTKFINGDTLLARITPCLENGKSAFVDFLAEDQTGWGSTEFVVLRPKEPLPPYHGYLLARHTAFREHAIQSMSGTSGRQRVQNDVLGKYLIVVPGQEITAVFGGMAGDLQSKIAANHEQAQTLTQLRDTLLPRLISGQLRLPEAETLLETMP